MVCPTDEVDGMYAIDVAQDVKSADVTIYDAGGVSADGNIGCIGPQQNAYHCSGEIHQMDKKTSQMTGPLVAIDILIPVSTLKAGAGQIKIGGKFSSCQNQP